MSKSNPNPVILVACSDIHFSHKPPLVRAVPNVDWYDVQERAWKQVGVIANVNSVAIAGDIFDRWNSPPRLISFVIEMMSVFEGCLTNRPLAIPGQHDLAFHIGADESAYGTLCAAKAIQHVPNHGWAPHPNMRIDGFSWGDDLKTPQSNAKNDPAMIALAHRYIWMDAETNPARADTTHYIPVTAKQLSGFDVCIFGDNHRGFHWQSRTGMQIVNCGTLMRRKADEIDYQPSVWLIHKDGSVKRVKLDCSEDKFIDSRDIKQLQQLMKQPISGDMTEFLHDLKSLGDGATDYRDAVGRFIRSAKIDKRVKHLILKYLEDE